MVINLSQSGETPVYFYFIYSISLVIGLGVYLRYRHKDYIDKERLGDLRDDITDIRKNKALSLWDRYSFHLSIIGRLGIVLYALASSETYAGTAVAAIIFESWVVWLVILRKFEGGKLKSEKSQTITLFIFSFFGLIFVNLSHNGIKENIVNDFFSPGLWIALGGAILTAVSIDRSLEFANKITRNEARRDKEKSELVDSGENARVVDNVKKQLEDKEKELADSVLVILIAHVAISIGLGTLFFVTNQISNGWLFSFPQFSAKSTIVIAIYAILLAPFTLIYPLKANIHAMTLEVNSIQYITPVLSIFFLLLGTRLFTATGLFENIDVIIERFDMFLIGSIIILAINLIFHFETGGIQRSLGKKEFGYKALIIALWCIGVFVFYRDPVFEYWFNFESSWLWEGTTDYFALLGLSSTIFILILSFRTLGLQERLRQEEHKATSLYWKMGLLSKDLKEKIINIDKSTPGIELENAELIINNEIVKLQNDAAGAPKNISKSQHEVTNELNENEIELTSMQIELSELVRSKQLGRNSTELMVLVGFALATIFITITTRPGFTTWNGFIIDLFSILFASTIVFVTYNLFEQRSKRNISIFDRKVFELDRRNLDTVELSDYTDESKSNSNQKNRSEALIPSIVCIVLLSIFAFLLFVKWHKTSDQFNWYKEICPTVSIDHTVETSGQQCPAHKLQ